MPKITGIPIPASGRASPPGVGDAAAMSPDVGVGVSPPPTGGSVGVGVGVLAGVDVGVEVGLSVGVDVGVDVGVEVGVGVCSAEIVKATASQATGVSCWPVAPGSDGAVGATDSLLNW